MSRRQQNKLDSKTKVSPHSYEALYGNSLPSTRGGALYNAFPYPTKISPEAIALYIASHTEPGDTVFDGFAGSGTTGLAALLCENPPVHLKQQAERLGLRVRWGARHVILYELGVIGAFVGQTLSHPPDPVVFRRAVDDILKAAERDIGWMYQASDPEGNLGTIRYVIWSDVLRCPRCRKAVSLWDACVSRNPAHIASRFACPFCSHATDLDKVTRSTETVRDDLIGQSLESRLRKAVWVYGTTGKKTWSRPVTGKDLTLLKRIAQEAIPNGVPRVQIPWGDLYRSGYHQGITHLHHFYTRRNLIVFAWLWEQTEKYKGVLRDALRFWLLSYNASHATIMTRVVAKSGQKDLVVTSAQPGVLYVSGLPVEKNLISGLRRKSQTIAKAFTITYGRKARVEVRQQSSCKVDCADQSVDYVFIDPPFGGNIPYAEINFINEAWLNRYSDRTEEIIVSGTQSKSIAEYQKLLTGSLSECYRILKRDGRATVVFHSATADVWNALQHAYKAAGFSAKLAGVLDKTQGSFKQVTTDGAVRGDPVVLLEKRTPRAEREAENAWTVAENLKREAAALAPEEQTAQRLYSRFVTHYLVHHQEVPLDADSFYRWHAEHRSGEESAVA